MADAVVSIHALERAQNRLSRRVRAGVEAEQLFGWLWEQGRPATKADFESFFTAAYDGCVYRVAVHKGCCVLVARDSLTGKFVTLIPKR